jgi:hypothetical protein
MYRASIWSIEVKQADVIIDNTNSRVIYFEDIRKGSVRKEEAIKTAQHKWHLSKEDALENIKENLSRSIIEAEGFLKQAKKKLEDFENLYK